MGKANDKKQMDAVNAMINTMINKVAMRDKKQCVIMLNEFIRTGTSSKHKMVKQMAWQFVFSALDCKQQANDGKIDSDILDSIEKTLKQSLSNTDRIVQTGSFKVLNLLHNLNESERVGKLFKKLSASKQKQFCKLYPQSTPDWFIKANDGKGSGKVNKKRLSAPRGRSKKRNVSIGVLEFGDVLNGKDLKRRDSLERMKKKPKKKKAVGKKEFKVQQSKSEQTKGQKGQ